MIGKFTKIIIIIFLVLVIGYFLVDCSIVNGEYILNNNPLMTLYKKLDQAPLIEDTHVKKIRIKETITIGDIKYNITSLNLGDNYSALYFDVDGISSVYPIEGAKLYQNGELLPYVTATCSSYAGSAIGFAPANGYDNLELHFDIIKELNKSQSLYPLDFISNTATIDVELESDVGKVTVSLTENGYEIISTGLEHLKIKKEFGNSYPVVYTLLQDGKALKDFSESNKPTHIIITLKESVYSGDTIVVPVS